MSALSHPSQKPSFIPKEIFRVYMTPQQLNKWFKVDGILPSSYIARCARFNKPINGKRGLYRPIDIFARAFAEAVSFNPTEDAIASNKISSLEEEIAVLTEKRKALNEIVLKMEQTISVSAVLPNELFPELNGRRLWSESDIVKNAVPYEEISGVYFLIKGKEVVYVGQSTNILQRIRDHRSSQKDFDSWAALKCKKRSLNVLESLYIHILKSPLNGRRDGYMVAPMSLDDVLGYLSGSVKQAGNSNVRHIA